MTEQELRDWRDWRLENGLEKDSDLIEFSGREIRRANRGIVFMLSLLVIQAVTVTACAMTIF